MDAPPASLPYPAPSPGGRSIVIVDAIFIVLVTLAVALRFGGRYMLRMRPLFEDWLICGGLLFQYAYFGVTIAAVYTSGIGYHLDQVPNEMRLFGLKLTIVVQVVYAFALGCTKTSVLLYMMRVFSTRTFRLAASFVLALVVAWAVAVILVTFLICTPLSYNWNTTTESGHCGNSNAGYLSLSIVDVITDGLILVLPIPLVVGLKMPAAQKIGVLAIFGLGAFTLAVGIVRLVTVKNIDFTDFTYSSVPVYIWAPLEPGMALIVACGVTLKPYLSRLMAGVNRVTGRNSSGQSRETANSNVLTIGSKPFRIRPKRVPSDDEMAGAFALTTMPRTESADGLRGESAAGLRDEPTPEPLHEQHQLGDA